jgi:hypothetical protein
MEMASAFCEQMFDRAFPLGDRTMLAVAQAPERQDQLIDLLDRAVARSLLNHAQLREIQVPLERFPQMDSKFWHIPVEDSGNPQVLRFFFEAPKGAYDAAA